MTTRYVAQTAGVFSGGTACNGQTAITPATWSGTAESAGDITWICGTINVPLSGTGMTVPSSGASGNPIVINFDTGAQLTSPGMSLGIVVSGKSFVTIDGKGVGIIQNTANGSGFANQVITSGVAISNSHDIIVQNLSVLGMCVHQPTDATTTGCHTNSNTIGTQGGSKNITIQGNTMSDAEIVLYYGTSNGDSGIVFNNNTISRGNWGIGVSPAGPATITGITITGNDIFCVVAGQCNWEGNAGAYHHNGIMIFPINFAQLQQVVIANNHIHDINGATTAGIFLDPQDGDTPGILIYNNVFNTAPITDGSGAHAGPANAWITGGINISGQRVFNNTIVGASSQAMSGMTNPTFENNIVTNLVGTGIELNTVGPGTCNTAAGGAVTRTNSGSPFFDTSALNQPIVINGVRYLTTSTTDSSHITVTPDPGNQTGVSWTFFYGGVTSDYNQFDGISNMVKGSSTTSFATWVSTGATDLGFIAPPDTHSITSAANLTASFMLNSSSPARGAGVNLTSLGISGLDIGAPQFFGVNYSCGTGCVSRPSSGAWDMGAYPFASGGSSNLSLSPGSNNFGNAPVHFNTSSFTFILTNSGTASATISSITFTGANPADFNQINNCGSSLGISSSCSIIVTFVPAASGFRSATLTVTDTDASSPQTASLTGMGITTQGISSSSSSFILNINSPWRITRY